MSVIFISCMEFFARNNIRQQGNAIVILIISALKKLYVACIQFNNDFLLW